MGKFVLFFSSLFSLALIPWAFATPRGPLPYVPGEDGFQASPAAPILRKVSASQLPSFAPDGDLEALKIALQRQIDSCKQGDLQSTRQFGNRKVSRQVWCVDTNQLFLQLAESSRSFAELMDQARSFFDWYQSTGRDGRGKVLFTAYDFPIVPVSATRTSRYRFPIYRKPDDLVQVVVNGLHVWRKKNPDGSISLYPTRAQIDQGGALAGKGYEIAYADDLLSIEILQIEGSGVLSYEQPDGTTTQQIIDYAAENGRPFVGIGSVLKHKGVDSKYLSIPGMREYYHEHPDELVPDLDRDTSYVFFRKEDQGPLGSGGLLLTPGHSIAVDTRVFPLGALALFSTTRPILSGEEVTSWEPFSRFALTQDTGGAIRGPGHVDIYWGEGDSAEQYAGRMAQDGELFYAIIPPAASAELP